MGPARRASRCARDGRLRDHGIRDHDHRGCGRPALHFRADTIDYTNPSGASQVADTLDIDLKKDTFLLITYSVRASLTPRTSTQIPMVFVRCQVDGAPCEPDANDIVWLIPEFCCDARTFTWVFPKATKGKHAVSILWEIGNPTAAHFEVRSRVVQAARL